MNLRELKQLIKETQERQESAQTNFYPTPGLEFTHILYKTNYWAILVCNN